MAKSRGELASTAGFTLAELMIVVAIILVVSGLSIPSLSRTIDQSRLSGAAQQLAAVYQDARIRATQNNTSLQVLVSPTGIQPGQICIDLDGDGTCNTGDPVNTFPGQVALSNVGVPVQLGAAQLHYPVANTENEQDVLVPGLTWNALGLPCERSSATAQCIAREGWVQHLQLQRANGDILYAAVTVSPTGRVKTWVFVPNNGNGQWF